MGASYIANTFAKCDTEKLNKLVMAEIEHAGYEDGHCFSGNWGDKSGCSVEDIVFNNTGEAEDYICEETDKSDSNLLAVKVLARSSKGFNSKPIDKKIKLLYTKLHALNPNDLTRKIVMRAQESKSKLRACGRCGSKVATQYITETYCPVCQSSDFLYTNTDLKRFNVLDSKRNKIMAEIQTQKNKKEVGIQKAIRANSSNKNWFWYVGGLCRD